MGWWGVARGVTPAGDHGDDDDDDDRTSGCCQVEASCSAPSCSCGGVEFSRGRKSRAARRRHQEVGPPTALPEPEILFLEGPNGIMTHTEVARSRSRPKMST